MMGAANANDMICRQCGVPLDQSRILCEVCLREGKFLDDNDMFMLRAMAYVIINSHDNDVRRAAADIAKIVEKWGG